MTEQHPEEFNEPDKGKWVFLGFLAGAVISALTLQYKGYIQFPKDEERAIVSEYRLLSLNPEYDVRMSTKSSGKEAFCESGYLLLRPQNGKKVAGILVDDKNRGIHCQADLTQSTVEE